MTRTGARGGGPSPRPTALNHRTDKYLDAVPALTGGHGVDLVVEMLANVNLGTDLGLLARGGKVAVVGSRGVVPINPRDLMSREASVFGVMLLGLPQAAVDEAMAYVQAGLRHGTLTPQAGQSFALAQAPAAHVEVIDHAAGTAGKITLAPWA